MAAPSKAIMPSEIKDLHPAGSFYSFDEMYRLAQVCHASGLFGDITDAAQAMIKIIKGQELGFPPTTAMTAFDIIAKRLFIKPWAIAAKINSCGYGSYRVTEQSPESCTIVFSRRYPTVGWQACPPVTYTFEEAKKHGLTERSSHWKSSPAHMLYNRAMGRGGAMYFPELLAGLSIPQETEPLPEAQHAENMDALFNMETRTPTDAERVRVSKVTGEVVDDSLFDFEQSAALDRELADKDE